MKLGKIIEIIGWIGTGCILVGYGLLSTGIVTDVLVYNGFMLVGSFAVALITFREKAWQPFVINVVFALLAFIAILRALLV